MLREMSSMLIEAIVNLLKALWSLAALAVVVIGFTIGLVYSSMMGDPTTAQTPPGPPPNLPTPIGTPSPDMLPKPPQFYSATATSTPKHPPKLEEFFKAQDAKSAATAEAERNKWGSDEDGNSYDEFMGPHTKGMKLMHIQQLHGIHGSDPEYIHTNGTKLEHFQLPDDVWVGGIVWESSVCYQPNPRCPEFPAYKLRRGNSPATFIWVGADMEVITRQKGWNEDADFESFEFLTDAEDDGQDDDDEQ